MTRGADSDPPPGTEEIDAPLSREQFLARIEVPMGDEERDEILDLIRWFTNRYPTPASRLAYARREQLRRPRRRARAEKEIDVEEYLKAVPDLAALELTVEEGPLKGHSIHLSNDGTFRIESSDLLGGEEGLEGDACLRSTAGLVLRLSGVITTRHTTSIQSSTVAHRVLEGRFLRATLIARSSDPGSRRRWRSYIRVPADFNDRLWFPFWYRDFSGSPGSRGWLPLQVRDAPLDVLWFSKTQCVVFERRDTSTEQFEGLTVGAAQLLSYLTGDHLLGSRILVAHDAVTAELAEVHWVMGQTGGHHIEAPVPMDFASLHHASKSLRPAWSRNEPDLAILGRCIDRLLDVPELVGVIQYLRLYPGMPLEASTGMLCLAIEAAAAFARNAPEISTTVIDELLAAFAAAGVDLSDEEQEALKLRNVVFHGRRQLGPPTPAAEREGWQRAVTKDRLLYTAANKLVLKLLGYQGPVTDWGRISPGKWEPHFVLI